MSDVRGEVASGYESVRDAFERNFHAYNDVGAGFCLYRDGIKVVDLHGGVTERDSIDPYHDNHLQMVFSTTKGATAICAHMLVERGQLDLAAPVADYWPEFAAHGKGDIPVGCLNRYSRSRRCRT